MKFFLIMICLCLQAFAQDKTYPFLGGHLFVPEINSTKKLSCNNCEIQFSEFILKKFNQAGDFPGPNCYNTALVASGFFSNQMIRYISPEEFELILKTNFQLTQTHEAGDIIVFDANSSRGHAAFYLGDNLIFQKKSYPTYYHYRITNMENAGTKEKNEYTPSPFDDGLIFDWPNLGNTKKQFYRLRTTNNETIEDPYTHLIFELEQKISTDLGKFKIASNYGIVFEYILSDFLEFLKKEKSTPMNIAKSISLKDQIFIFLEDVYFRRSQNPERVTKDLCIPVDETNLIHFLSVVAEIKNISKTKVDLVLNKMRNQDLEKCSYHPLQELIQ